MSNGQEFIKNCNQGSEYAHRFVADIEYRVFDVLRLVFMGQSSVIPVACCFVGGSLSSRHRAEGTGLHTHHNKSRTMIPKNFDKCFY